MQKYDPFTKRNVCLKIWSPNTRKQSAKYIYQPPTEVTDTKLLQSADEAIDFSLQTIATRVIGYSFV